MFGLRQFSVIGSTSKKYDTADHYLTSLANIHAVVVRIFIILSQHVTSLQGAFVAVITDRSGRTQDGSKR